MNIPGLRRPNFTCLFGSVATAFLVLGTVVAAPAEDFDVKDFGGKTFDWHGFSGREFPLEGRTCKVVSPEKAAEGRPWVWRAVFWGHEPQVEIALLKKGYAVAHIDCSDWLGSPVMLRERDAFYRLLTEKHGFSPKPVLLGMSRGGLCSLRWATANPDKVACIYVDAPVCDIKSWPGGRGKASGSPGDWKRLLERYGLSEQEALEFQGNPVDVEVLQSLARRKIPILSVCGDADTVVPMEENTTLLANRYRQLGGPIAVFVKPGIGHHPHSLKDPGPISDFLLRCQEPEGTATVEYDTKIIDPGS